MVDAAPDQDIVSRLISKLNLALNWLMPIAADAAGRERRAHNQAAVIQPLGFITHLIFIFLFAYWGIAPLALFNVFSVILWMVIAILIRQQKVSEALLVMVFEVPLHATLVIYFVGWGMGAQYLLLPMIIGSAILNWSIWTASRPCRHGCRRKHRSIYSTKFSLHLIGWSRNTVWKTSAQLAGRGNLFEQVSFLSSTFRFAAYCQRYTSRRWAMRQIVICCRSSSIAYRIR